MDDDLGEGGDDGVSPKEVGHNIYILCHQLAQHNKELAALLKPSDINIDPGTNQALIYYNNHTAQIEVSFYHTQYYNQQYLNHTFFSYTTNTNSSASYTILKSTVSQSYIFSFVYLHL